MFSVAPLGKLMDKKVDYEKLREKMHERALERALTFYRKKHQKNVRQ